MSEETKKALDDLEDSMSQSNGFIAISVAIAIVHALEDIREELVRIGSRV